MKLPWYEKLKKWCKREKPSKDEPKPDAGTNQPAKVVDASPASTVAQCPTVPPKGQKKPGGRLSKPLLSFLSHTLVGIVTGIVVTFLNSGGPAGINQTMPPVQVYFSPNGGCTEAICREIRGLTNNLLIQSYSFTSKEIATEVVRAHRRGIKVCAILDKSQRTEKYSEADFLQREGIITLIDDAHAIAHNKIMIGDAFITVSGSFNFTTSAEKRNAENLLIIRDPELAFTYIKNWDSHRQHSIPYSGRQ
jgi:phosphatidylserine/phosphatidylglycerophosphate/cardiolipin synthase-like enzyme